MAISAQDVNKLRTMTGAGMMDCKKALEEANGDFEEAIVLLRKKGQKISEKRADMEAKEGMVFVKTNADHTEGTLVAINCETDFVAKNEAFVNLGNAILEAAIQNKPADKEALKLLVIDGKPVQEHIVELMGKIGEKLEITAYEQLTGDKVITYIHVGSKLGVLVSMTGVNGTDVTELGKDIAMQIAAMKPVALDKEDVDPTIINQEIEIGKEQARQEGKPEAMLEKIALGKLNKFYQESTLLNQAFVKDTSKTISQLVQGTSKDLKIKAFKRIAIG
jgi:elongation factor Ts